MMFKILTEHRLVVVLGRVELSVEFKLQSPFLIFSKLEKENESSTRNWKDGNTVREVLRNYWSMEMKMNEWIKLKS